MEVPCGRSTSELAAGNAGYLPIDGTDRCGEDYFTNPCPGKSVLELSGEADSRDGGEIKAQASIISLNTRH